MAWFLRLCLIELLILSRGQAANQFNWYDENSNHNATSCPKDQDNIWNVDLLNMELTFANMVLIDENDYDKPKDFEDSSRKIGRFFIDKNKVSNADFAKFVEDRNYVTDAEYYKAGFVPSSALNRDTKSLKTVNTESWCELSDANWQFPEGGNCSVQELQRMSYPVVHVSWRDATFYCKWKIKGGRLPTAVEWETACYNGKYIKLYPWEIKTKPKRNHLKISGCWKQFLKADNDIDEYEDTGSKMFNMVENVWEWTSTGWTHNSTKNWVVKGGPHPHNTNKDYHDDKCAACVKVSTNTTNKSLGFRCAVNAEKR